MNTPKERSDLGFDDAFDGANPDEWALEESSVSNDSNEPEKEQIKQIAEESGFPSRDTKKPIAKPSKEPMDQINFRAKASTIKEFRALCEAQEPKWPMGYTLERAVAALKKELSKP